MKYKRPSGVRDENPVVKHVLKIWWAPCSTLSTIGVGETGKKRNEPCYNLESSGKKRHGGEIGSDGEEGENHLRVRVDRASLVRPIWVAQREGIVGCGRHLASAWAFWVGGGTMTQIFQTL